jgi:hypothetical protein
MFFSHNIEIHSIEKLFYLFQTGVENGYFYKML